MFLSFSSVAIIHPVVLLFRNLFFLVSVPRVSSFLLPPSLSFLYIFHFSLFFLYFHPFRLLLNCLPDSHKKEEYLSAKIEVIVLRILLSLLGKRIDSCVFSSFTKESGDVLSILLTRNKIFFLYLFPTNISNIRRFHSTETSTIEKRSQKKKDGKNCETKSNAVAIKFHDLQRLSDCYRVSPNRLQTHDPVPFSKTPAKQQQTRTHPLKSTPCVRVPGVETERCGRSTNGGDRDHAYAPGIALNGRTKA